MKNIVIVLLAALLSGCNAPPQPVTADNLTTATTREIVWAWRMEIPPSEPLMSELLRRGEITEAQYGLYQSNRYAFVPPASYPRALTDMDMLRLGGVSRPSGMRSRYGGTTIVSGPDGRTVGVTVTPGAVNVHR